MKSTPRDGIALITLGKTDSETQVIVEDPGIGIPRDSLENLSEEFYRAPNAKELETE